MHVVFVGKPDGKRPLRRPSRKWEDIIKEDLYIYIEWVDIDWFNLAHDVN
jgi:hypothetical protein